MMVMISLSKAIKFTRSNCSNDLKTVVQLVSVMIVFTSGLVVADSSSATRPAPATRTIRAHLNHNNHNTAPISSAAFGRRLGSATSRSDDTLETSANSLRPQQSQEPATTNVRYGRPIADRQAPMYFQATSQDLNSADQLDEPTFVSSTSEVDSQGVDQERIGAAEPTMLDNFSESKYLPGRRQRQQLSSNLHRDSTNYNENNEDDETMENSQDSPDRNVFMNNHNTQLRAMRDMFERRHLDHNGNNNNHHHHHRQQQQQQQNSGNPLQSSQELSPISIGLDPGSPFAMPPFQMGPNDGASQPPPPAMGVHMKPQMSNGDNLDGNLGPSLPFGLNPLPHLLGFQNSAFDGPQRGDQSAHSNQHASAAPQPDSELAGGGASGSGQKTWPKIFRFTDGRINLSDFEKQKKIRLSNKNHGENHIESAPIMFDNRPLKRKSFLILHGGVFPGN